MRFPTLAALCLAAALCGPADASGQTTRHYESCFWVKPVSCTGGYHTGGGTCSPTGEPAVCLTASELTPEPKHDWRWYSKMVEEWEGKSDHIVIPPEKLICFLHPEKC